jgi:hypothetical protein
MLLHAFDGHLIHPPEHAPVSRRYMLGHMRRESRSPAPMPHMRPSKATRQCSIPQGALITDSHSLMGLKGSTYTANSYSLACPGRTSAQAGTHLFDPMVIPVSIICIKPEPALPARLWHLFCSIRSASTAHLHSSAGSNC